MINPEHFLIAAVLAALAGCAGAGPSRSGLDAELAEILDLLPGRYAGSLGGPGDSGSGGMLYHRIERVSLPEHGDTVVLHVISRQGFDDPKPFQQKFYAFDTNPDRVRNQMLSIVVMQAPRWGEGDALDEGRLISFPTECAIRWSRDQRGLVARVKRGDCVYQSQALGGPIEPDMTYVVNPDSFAIEDLLYRADGTLLTPASGLLVAPRQASQRD